MMIPLTLTQFISSFSVPNMTVGIDRIARGLNTDVRGIQITLSLFTLVMASLMIPGSKLTEVWGTKRCFMAGLLIYGAGALAATLASGLGVMIVGYSFLQGIGSALLIPSIYILVSVAFQDPRARARNFGIILAAGGLGSAAGTLIGGVITGTLGWRAAFLAQVCVVAIIIVLAAARITAHGTPDRPAFDLLGAALSAAGLFLIVFGILLADAYGWLGARTDLSVAGTVVIARGGVSPIWLFVGFGAAVLAWFGVHLRRREERGRQPLLSLKLLRNRTANLGLAAQGLQGLIVAGAFFDVSVFVQAIHGFDGIETGLVLTPATAGIFTSSTVAGRLAKKHSPRRLIRMGFLTTSVGMALLLALVRRDSPAVNAIPGLVLMGLGIGAMKPASVNVVQSAFRADDQADISGLSRSVSNLGGSLGVALAGSVIAAAAVPGGRPYATSMVVLVVMALAGLAVAMVLPVPVSAVGAPRLERIPGTDSSRRRRTS